MFREIQAKIKEAKSVLLVGAGSNGVELAPFIKYSYPEKKVTLCHRGSTILPQLKGAHETAMAELKKVGVEILLETPYSEDSELHQ